MFWISRPVIPITARMIALPDIDLVIFDCDGVLVDSEPLSNAVLAKHAARLGWAMDAEESQSRFVGMTMTQVHDSIEAKLETSLDQSWIDQYYTDCFALFSEKLTAVDGVDALIRRVLGAGKKICVASQGPHEKMQLTLGVTGLGDYFTGHIFSARDVARPKPFPDLFRHAANSMDVAPQRCCVIEDSLSGVRAANAAGMPVIHYAPRGLANDGAVQDIAASVSAMHEIFS